MLKEKYEMVPCCDFCGSNKNVFEKCLGCGADVCFECAKKAGKDFPHSTWGSGSGDGYFCNSCLSKPPEKIQKILSLYLRIQELRIINEGFYEKFKKDAANVEAELKKEYDRIKGKE